MLLRFLLIAIITIAHVWVLFVIYPTGHIEFAMLLTTSVAFSLYVLVLPKKRWLTLAVALILSLLSLWAGMVAALNTYGS